MWHLKFLLEIHVRNKKYKVPAVTVPLWAYFSNVEKLRSVSAIHNDRYCLVIKDWQGRNEPRRQNFDGRKAVFASLQHAMNTCLNTRCKILNSNKVFSFLWRTGNGWKAQIDTGQMSCFSDCGMSRYMRNPRWTQGVCRARCRARCIPSFRSS